MKIRQRRHQIEWWIPVALATLVVVSSLAPAWGGEPRSVAPGPDGPQIASIVPPPEPPRPLDWVRPDTPNAADDPSGPIERAEATEPAADEELVPLTPRWLEDPLFEDPRSERTIPLAPGIWVPVYPVVVNAPVEALIDYFTARERDRFRLWLSRSGRYLEMIQQVFRDRGLPEELAYTAMIESGFNPRAVSRVGAKGLWQFMEATGRRYGLTVNRWVDERYDPVKATIAAAQYLGDLYGMFGHWFLAQAAYNAGEARVAQAIQRARTSDFWALTQTRHLPQETKMFVPQILAATVITRAPARYGFEVAMESPLAYDEVAIRRALDLETVATLAQVTVDEVRDLNPALRTSITPPFGGYQLRLPVGAGSRFETALLNAAPSEFTVWDVHRIGRNQSLAEIARLYHVTPQRLAEINQLPGGRLRGLTELVVPVSNRNAAAIVSLPGKGAAKGGAAEPRTARPAPPSPSGPKADGAPREVVVRRGDTLSGIAARHGLELRLLARLNGLELADRLQPGDRLKLRTP